ncbi:MAG: hypothetical protein ACP5PW_04255, partial [Candidatus Dormibacteria bacterium]
AVVRLADRPTPPNGGHELLFGEGSGRYLLSVEPGSGGRMEEVCSHLGVSCVRVGEVGGDSVEIAGLARIPLEDAAEARLKGIAGAMKGPVL